MQQPGLTPLVEGDHVNAQMLGDLDHVLPVRVSHRPEYMSLEDLAVTTHRSVPSSHLVVKVIGMKRHQLT